MNTTITNIAELLLMTGDLSKHPGPRELLGVVNSAALAIVDGKIAWFGNEKDLPSRFLEAQLVDAQAGVVMPALIDSHTHAVFGGSREFEYEERCLGVSYSDIAERGGGIKLTMKLTRETPAHKLYDAARARLLRMMASGVAHVEIKSGYGLDLHTEIKQLEVIQQLKQDLPLRIYSTFMGAHEFPPEFPERSEYIDFIIEKVLPEVAKRNLAQFCDIFCDKGVYTVTQAKRVLVAARDLGFKLKIHAEELACTGGAELAAELRAVSADHLMMISDAGIRKMADSGVVFNLLPATTLFLGKQSYAPARKIIDAGGLVALSTDCNPGSSHCENLLFITTLGCSTLHMSASEVLWAVTRGGALALDKKEGGSIHLNSIADLALFGVPNYQSIPYGFGRNVLTGLWIGGSRVV